MDWSTLLAIGIVVYFLYKWGVSSHGFFYEKGVKFIKPLPFLGSSLNMFTQKQTMMEWIVDKYLEFPDEK
jgi:hypothetical protein